MTPDLIALTRAMDRCWQERRFDDLADFMAHDVVMVAPGGKARMEGLAAAVESYREFMGRCRVDAFETRDHVVTARGDSAVVEYAWTMAWDDAGEAHRADGREILVLCRRDGAWRVVWRTQLGG